MTCSRMGQVQIWFSSRQFIQLGVYNAEEERRDQTQQHHTWISGRQLGAGGQTVQGLVLLAWFPMVIAVPGQFEEHEPAEDVITVP